MKKHRLIVVMGVSGSGKSTIGKALAKKLNLDFYDGDDFHPEENIAKMAKGLPLNDDDRWPWLEAINAFAKENTKDSSLVVACSALKESYRKLLAKGIQCTFIYLKGSREQIFSRLEQRSGHFMPSSLLESQFAALEEPREAINISIDQSIKDMIKLLVDKLV